MEYAEHLAEAPHLDVSFRKAPDEKVIGGIGGKTATIDQLSRCAFRYRAESWNPQMKVKVCADVPDTTGNQDNAAAVRA